jgi:hemolysin III
MGMAQAIAAVNSKPLLRGWSHQIAFFFALAAGIALVVLVPPGRSLATGAVYAATLATLFGVSALYHRPNWSRRSFALMRRLDHSAIFLLIAGSYTALSRALPDANATRILVLAWSGALAGCLRAIFWPRAPKPIVALLYVLFGWGAIWFVPDLYQSVGLPVMIWVIVGGALYTIGALVFALRRPNPWPKVFGFHEVFHLFVIFAAAAHFVAVSMILMPSRPG